MISGLQKPIFLIGLRASGKTTLAKALCKKYHLSLYDTDAMFKEHLKVEIADYVKEKGWDAFREREKEQLFQTPLTPCIVSTGGGVILKDENRKYLKNNGICIFLDASHEILYQRLKKNPLEAQRPAFKEESLQEEIQRLYTERRTLYLDVADLRLNANKSLPSLIIDIELFLKKFLKKNK